MDLHAQVLANFDGCTTLVFLVVTFSAVGISGATDKIGGIGLLTLP